MKKLGLCLIAVFVIITTGCGPMLMNSKFDDRYLPNAQPGKPLVSLDIPREITEKHKVDYWAIKYKSGYRMLLWESDNNFFLLYLQDPQSKGDKVWEALDRGLMGGQQDASTSEPQINEVYAVDISKKEFTVLSDTEKADIAARIKDRYKFYASKPKGALNTISSLWSGDRHFEGDVRQDDVDIHLNFVIVKKGDKLYPKVTVNNNLFDKTEKWFLEERNTTNLDCQINSYTIRNLQLSPDGQKYYLCGSNMYDITKRDKNEYGVTDIVKFEKIDAGLYKNQIKNYVGYKHGDEIYELTGVLTLRFNKDWSKLAMWNYFYKDNLFTERIEIYPSKY